jgi:hypothetical protein
MQHENIMIKIVNKFCEFYDYLFKITNNNQIVIFYIASRIRAISESFFLHSCRIFIHYSV